MQFEVYRKTGRRELVLAHEGGVNGRLNDEAGYLGALEDLITGDLTLLQSDKLS
jgi:hypothetical protein